MTALKKLDVTALITCERVEESRAISRFGVEEFVTDNVIVLRNTLEDEKRRRTFEVMKYRGSMHYKGEYPFTISNQGIEAMTISGNKLTQESLSKRRSSGNLKLDEMCGGGGYFCDSIILISGATGTGKTLVATTFLNDGCLRKERSLLFAFEDSRQQVFRSALNWSMDYEKFEKEGLIKILSDYPEALKERVRRA